MAQEIAGSMFFPRNISERIKSVLLSPVQPPWQEKEAVLDAVVSYLVRYGYHAIPGIRERMNQAGLHPDDITDFRSYEGKFPITTIMGMSALGQMQFQRTQGRSMLHASIPDLEVVCKTVLREEAGATRSEKVRGMVEINRTAADSRAAQIALAGELMRQPVIPEIIVINQKQGNTAYELMRNIVAPAFFFAGITPLEVTSLEAVAQIASSEKQIGLLVSGDNKLFELNDPAAFSFLVAASDKHVKPGSLYSIYIGDYNAEHGAFPNLGIRMPFPWFVRPTDPLTQGAMFRKPDCNPDLAQKGKIVIDHLLSAYEMQAPASAMLHSLAQAQHILDLEHITAGQLDSQWHSMLGDQYSFRSIFLSLLERARIKEHEELAADALSRLYGMALQEYIKHAVRFGVPNSFLLKIGLPIYARMDAHGLLTGKVGLSSLPGLGNKAYIAGDDFQIKYSPEDTPYISLNIIGSPDRSCADRSSERMGFPELRHSFLNARTRDAIKGRNLAGTGKDGYITTAAIASQSDISRMFMAAAAYSMPENQETHAPPISPPTLEDITGIMSRLHEEISTELERAHRKEPSMISVFSDMTRIPIAEIESMVQRAKADFVGNGGLGLKRMLYAAMINGHADINRLDEKDLQEGLEAIAQKTPVSPLFMVTPGNITLYDAFCLFGQIMLATLSNQSEKRLTLYVKPSESDVALNYLVYKFHRLAEEIDPNNAKGFRTLFQKAYWSSSFDEGNLQKGMAAAAAGIYYGGASTFTVARFRASLDFAAALGHPKEAVEKLLEIGGRKGIEYSVAAALESAQHEDVPAELMHDVHSFAARHHIFPETLNAAVVLPDAHDIAYAAKSILGQVISTRGADCTNIKKVWVHQSVYEAFAREFEAQAAELVYGNPMDPRTRLAQYETDMLKGTQTIISDPARASDTKIIPPKTVAGEQAKKPIDPDRQYTGVIVTNIAADTLLNGDPIEREIYLDHLANEGGVKLPWVNMIVYETKEQLIGSMDAVRARYHQRSGYPRYLYVAAMGRAEADQLESKVMAASMADLFKKGDEAHNQFMYYRPHQGTFFLNVLVQ